MACEYPLMGFRQGDGSVNICGSWYERTRGYSDVEISMRFPGALKLPCGQCRMCRLKKSSDWAVRCMLEAKQYPKDQVWFVTLTYDDEHLSYKMACNYDTGECSFLSPSLIKDEISHFMKDLRRFYEYHYKIHGIRFFGCGEYGAKFRRPHYHVIIFGLPIFDLRHYEHQKKGAYTYYTSEILSSIWNRGLVCVGECSFDTCAYVARYIMKKQTGKESERYYVERGIIPEYNVMSRRPGIAYDWYKAHKNEIFDSDSVLSSIGKGKYVPKPPAYYDRLFDLECPDKMKDIKGLRKKFALISERKRRERSSLCEEDYIKQCADNKFAKIDSIPRKLG